ncbi:MAG: DUF6073 family protein, partial [Thermoanaerobaculia bacterium]|nr:DUF6073 family protein [Thermoanaerobaculia bacterium]
MQPHLLLPRCRQFAIFLIWALFTISARDAYGQDAPCRLFSPAGLDESPSLGMIILDILPLSLRDTVFVAGPTVIQRGEPQEDSTGKRIIPTQIVSMNLQGTTSLLGQLHLRLSPDLPSMGQIKASQSGKDLPAHSYFDVFVDVFVAGMTLRNIEPLRVEARIGCIPPYGEAYQHFQGAAVPLVNPVGTPVAAIIQAVHKLETPLFSVVPGANLDVAALGPFEFAGRRFFGAGIAEPRPPAAGWPPFGR